MRISLNRYGSKIRKVSRRRPTVSNETILETTQEFFYKNSPHTKSNWHCTIGFLIKTASLNVYFIIHYHLFFREEFFIRMNTCINECDIRMFLFVFCLRNRPSIKYVRNWGNGVGSHPKCVEIRTGRRGWKIGHKIRTY